MSALTPKDMATLSWVADENWCLGDGGQIWDETGYVICWDATEKDARAIVLTPALATAVIEQQAEIERLRAFISDFAGNRFERIERRAQDPQDDHDPVTDWNAIDAWQDDARAVLEGKP